MGAVSGESAGGRGAVNDDLLVMADCSLVLGRRSVFILNSFSPPDVLGGARARLKRDDSTHRPSLNKKAVADAEAKGEGVKLR